jgi:hypothetical protein
MTSFPDVLVKISFWILLNFSLFIYPDFPDFDTVHLWYLLFLDVVMDIMMQVALLTFVFKNCWFKTKFLS